jgi:hypothetical protein
MRFLVHADKTQDMIGQRAVPPEHENDQLLTAFLPALAELGAVQAIEDPKNEVDAIFERCNAVGEACVFLCFALPHRVPPGLRCPTVVVFPWGYSTIPDTAWGGDTRNDWRTVLASCGRAITLSGYASDAVRKAMGEQYDVETVLPPVWDRVATVRTRRSDRVPLSGGSIRGKGIVSDTLTAGFTAEYLIVPVRPLEQPPPSPAAIRRAQFKRIWRTWSQSVRGWFTFTAAPKPKKLPPPLRPFEVAFEGVVYTSVLNPNVTTSGWKHLLTAFCWAFRDTPDATLILNMTSDNFQSYRDNLVEIMSRLTPFRCRVVVIHAKLDKSEYESLMEATTFYVNASECEGVSVPMLEFMASGTPVIAPDHTAMKDYVAPDSGFIVKTWRQLSRWPHDPRGMLHSENYRLNWETLLAGFRESYQISKSDPERYRAMSRASVHRIRANASHQAAAGTLRKFFLMRDDLKEQRLAELTV